jgi:iron complex transport system ATP-binding protein
MSALLDCNALVSGRAGQALHPAISFTINAGESVCLLGRNGAGKSTLLLTLLGQLPGLAGEIAWQGAPVAKIPAAQLSGLVAFVPQRPVVPEGMRVDELLRLGGYRFLSSKMRKSAPQVLEVLARVGLQGFEARQVSALSGGEQQRAMVARALMQNAHAIILDEPTAHLDVTQQSQILALLRQICAAGTAVIFSSHDPNDALRNHARTLAFLADGSLEMRAPGAIEAAHLARIYGGAFTRVEIAGSARFLANA